MRSTSHNGWAGFECDLSTPRSAGSANVFGGARRSGGRDVGTKRLYQPEFMQPGTYLIEYIYITSGLSSGVR